MYKMTNAFKRLVSLARTIETDNVTPESMARDLAKQVLDFSEEHVMLTKARTDGDSIEMLVPFVSPLRDIDSATGGPSWTVVPSSVVRLLQRAIPFLVRLGDHLDSVSPEGEARCELLGDMHEALTAVGADVPNGYPDAAELERKRLAETGARGGNPQLAELIKLVEVFPSDAVSTLPRPADIELLTRALVRYEATGDHNHGRGPMKPGAPCPAREHDCYVYKARVLIDRARQATCAACRDQANGIIQKCPTHGEVRS